MKPISTFAIALSLLAGGAVLATPAVAQKNKKAAAAEPAGPKLSKEERATLIPLQTAVQAKDFATAATLLPAAQAAAKGQDARHIIASLQLQMALGTNDQAGQAAAIEAMLANGSVPQQDQARLYRALGQLYTNLKRPEQATAALQKLAQLEPNSSEAVLALAEARAREGNRPEAIKLIERAIASTKAAGQPVPENWYKRALRFAYESKMQADTLRLSQALVQAYPTPENWRDALTIYRQQANLDKAGETDVLRLMRAAKAMKGDSDFLTLASNLNDAGLPGESKAVIDEGVQARLISPTKDYFRTLLSTTGGRVAADKASLPGIEGKAKGAANGRLALSTGDAFYGYGDYAKAADLYRTAVQKGGVDANIANTRLGMALAMAGRKAEAEAAFRAVTGARAPLAQYWLLWLAQRG
jgi:tetratricopeptide (TPR) repeat protein